MSIDYKVLLDIAFDLKQAQNELNRQIKSLQKASKLALNIELSDKEARKVIETSTKMWTQLRKEAVEAFNAPNIELKKMGQYYKELEKLSDSFLKKNINAIDLEIQKREEQAKKYSNLLKAQIQERIETERLNIDKTILDNNITKFLNENKKLSDGLKNKIIEIQNQIKNADALTLKNLQREFRSATKEAEALGMTGRTALGELANNTKKFFSWYSIAGVVTGAVRTIKGMINVIIELDDSLIELQKVTDLTGQELDKFIDKAYDLGSQIARTGKEVIDATTVFRRAGYSLEDSLNLAEAALVMVNVGDGIKTVENAASSLIATLKGFNLSETDAMRVVDMINEVSNTAPIDFDNITEGLRRISGTLSQTGTSIEETIGLLTAGFARLRDIEMVSSGLLMVSQRLRGITEDGEEIDGLMPKLQKAFKEIANIDIQNTNGQLRSTYEILSDMAKVFPTLTDEQRQYLGELAAGNRQVKVLNAILAGWEDVEKAVISASNSQGSAIKENEKVLESIQGKINAVRSSFEQLSQHTIESDWIKYFLDLSNVLIKTIDKVGLFNIALITLVGVLGSKTSLGLNTFANQLTILATKVGITSSAVTSLSMALSTILPVVAGLLIIKGITIAYDHFNQTLEETQELLSQQVEAYNQITSEIERLEEQLNTTKSRLEELNSVGGVKLTKDGEKEKLEAQTAELERQLSILKEKQRIAALEAEETAIRTLTTPIKSRYGGTTFNSDLIGTYTKPDEITRDFELQRTMNKYDQLARSYKRLQQEQEELIKSGESTPKLLSKYDTELKNISDQMEETRQYANELATALQKDAEGLTGVTEEGKKHKEIINNVLQLYDDWLKDLDATENASLRLFSANDDLIKENQESYLSIEEQNEIIDEYQKQISAIEKALQNLNNLSPTEIMDLLQEFPQLKDYGYTGSEGIDVLRTALEKTLKSLYYNLDSSIEYKNVLRQIRDHALNTANAIDDVSDSLAKVNKSGKLLQDVKDEVKELGYISSETLHNIGSQSTELKDAVTRFNAGLIDTNELINELSKAYETDVENYKNAVINKLSENENFFNNVKEKLPDWVKTLAETYNIDYQNWITLHKAKLELLKKLYNEQHTYDELREKSWEGRLGVHDLVDLEASRQAVKDIQSIIDELDKAVNITLNFKGYSSSKTSTGKEKDLIKEAFDREKSYIDYLLGTEQIDETEYYDRLEKINEKYFGANKKKYLEEYRKYVVDIYQGRKKIEDDVIKGKFTDLKFKLDMDEIDEEKYYAELRKLNDKYYKDVKKYQDEYRDNLIKLHEWEIKEYERKLAVIEAEITRNANNIQDILNEIEVANGKGTEEQYQKLIDLSNKEIELYTQRKQLAEEQLKNIKYDTDEYRNLEKVIQDCENAIADAYVSQNKWNKAILELPIQQLERFNDTLKETLDELNEIKNTYDRIISAVVDVIDDEIDGINKQKENTENYYDNLINKAKDELDLLKKINEERERQYKWQQALYELERARNQKVDKIYREGQGFVYEADTDAIRKAQETLDQLTYDKIIYTKENEIEALEKAKKSALESYDVQIKRLNDIKKLWNDIADSIQRMADLDLAEKLFGEDWQRKILSGDNSLLELMKTLYGNLDENIQKIEKQIKANDKMIKSINKYVAAWEDGAVDVEKAQDMIQEALENAKNYEKLILEDRLENVKNFAEEYIKWADKCVKAIAKIEENFMTLQFKYQEVQDYLSTLKNNAPILKIGKSHKGMELGYIGNTIQSQDAFRIIALDTLKPDEIIRVLKINEAVLTEMQQSNILNNVLNSYKAGINTAMSAVTSKQSSSPVFQFTGDIHLHEVQHVDELANEIVTNFIPLVNQELHKR